jgi:hypothetical protein
MPYDGHIAINGVDTSSDPALIVSGVSAIDSVNRAFRGGVSRTRPPFRSMILDFDSDESRNVFENGNVSGVFSYKKIDNFRQPHLIVAVGNMILAGRVYADRISFKCLYDEVDPQWQHSFFVQAEEILVWQNGKQTPQVWDGLSSLMESAPDAVASVGKSNPMPIGNIMLYAHGRIFVATESNIVYASDHIYSQGFGKNKTVVNFEETTYPSSGDGFGTYSHIGRITGLGVVPRHPQPNGHGEVVVFGENGAWAIDPTPNRTDWSQLSIQQVILIGRGCASPHSVVPVNNDIFYRCSDGTISSLKHNLTERQQAWTDRSLSREVSRYLEFDSLDSLQFSSSIFSDNRLLMSCAVRMSRSESYGIHRYGLGLVSLDLDRGNTTNKIDVGFSWDGLWTGPRPTGMAKIYTDGEERDLIASYDSDGVNRIYKLSKDSVNDYRDGVEVPIRGFYSVGDLFNSSNPSDAPALHSLLRSSVFVSEINDIANVSVDYRPDRHPLWLPILDEYSVGCDTNCEDLGDHLNEDNDDADCADNPGDSLRNKSYPFLQVKNYGETIGSETPNKTSTRSAVNKSTGKGFSFQARIQTEGVVTVNRLVMETSAQKDVNLFAIPKETCYCNRESGCNEQEEYFEYQL